MPEQGALCRRSECRRPAELQRPADVVQEGGPDEQVGAKPGMDLRSVTADSRDGDGVLEQAAGVVVVDAGARRQLAP